MDIARWASRGHAPAWPGWWCFLCIMVVGLPAAGGELLVEAERFAEHGGWVVDPQFMDVMGSSYLLAHGLGRPVGNAKTEVEFPEPGAYRLWVRTKDWVPSHHPGRFKVSVNGVELAAEFGTRGDSWMWQDGGVVDLRSRMVRLELKDLTGFDGRCDALYFTTDKKLHPPTQAGTELAAWRRRLLNLPEIPPSGGDYDTLVVGGGLAGCSAALTAGRLGLRVGLIQNRPVLGGNASREIGLFPRGQNRSIVEEIAGDKAEQIIRAQTNIQMWLGWHAFRVQTNGNRILSVDARHIATGEERRFAASVFVDATGHGSIGYWAGADYRLGREASAEFNESLAPREADRMHHGNTVIFRTRQAASPTTFPEVPWATAVAKDYAHLGGQVHPGRRDNVDGLTHQWEYGQWLDPVADAEQVRDRLLRALYGTFANAKRREPEKNANLELAYVGFVPAGGESRRLMGEHILTENDIRAREPFPDAVANCTGHFCLHYPGGQYDFRLGDWKWIAVDPYTVPFRCLYSRNVENLMMAGKCISVSHIAGSSTKTMLNGGQTGVAVGAASFLCRKYKTTPQGVYRGHLAELQDIVFERGDYRSALGKPRGAVNP